MKKPYERPRVKRVKLIAEEAILTLCKTDVERTARNCTSGGCIGTNLTTS